MSVIVTIRMQGDGAKFEEIASKDPGRMRGIADKGKAAGAIAHRFYGSEDGSVMVIDEWPDAQSFQAFFDAHQDEIGPLMAEAGVTDPPEITIWRKLETGDDVGWGA